MSEFLVYDPKTPVSPGAHSSMEVLGSVGRNGQPGLVQGLHDLIGYTRHKQIVNKQKEACRRELTQRPLLQIHQVLPRSK